MSQLQAQRVNGQWSKPLKNGKVAQKSTEIQLVSFQTFYVHTQLEKPEGETEIGGSGNWAYYKAQQEGNQTTACTHVKC